MSARGVEGSERPEAGCLGEYRGPQASSLGDRQGIRGRAIWLVRPL